MSKLRSITWRRRGHTPIMGMCHNNSKRNSKWCNFHFNPISPGTGTWSLRCLSFRRCPHSPNRSDFSSKSSFYRFSSQIGQNYSSRSWQDLSFTHSGHKLYLIIFNRFVILYFVRQTKIQHVGQTTRRDGSRVSRSKRNWSKILSRESHQSLRES